MFYMIIVYLSILYYNAKLMLICNLSGALLGNFKTVIVML